MVRSTTNKLAKRVQGCNRQRKLRKRRQDAIAGKLGLEAHAKERLHRNKHNERQRVARAAAAREKKAPGAPIASRVGSRKSSRPDAFPWLETVECTGPQMERVANRFVRWKNISADAEWHSGDKRTNTCIAVEFQNLRGQWCPRFEKRTSSLGQCFGLFAATVFVEGALVTVYCGRVQRSMCTPFCVDSKRYTAEITSEGKKNRGSLILLVGQSIASRTISTVGRRSEVTFVCARVEGCLRLATSQLGKSFSFPMAGAL